MVLSQKAGSQDLEETFLSCETGKKLTKVHIHVKKTEKEILKEEGGEEKSLLLFSTGRTTFLIFCFYLPLHLLV